MQPADLLELLRFLGVALFLALQLLSPGVQLSGAYPQIALPLADLDQMDGTVDAEPLSRLKAADRHHADACIQPGSLVAVFGHWFETPIMVGGRLVTSSQVNDVGCPEPLVT